jgi:CspA family cold shock protein
MKGTVKWYDRVKGYGFLQTEDDKDIFIHRSGLEVSHTELEAGQAVEFEIEQREKLKSKGCHRNVQPFFIIINTFTFYSDPIPCGG